MKDPAILFYTESFLIGCADLTMEERGQYITLLCLQHQKGHLNRRTIDVAIGTIRNRETGETISLVSDYVLEKFSVDENGCYYNKRLETEIIKRESYARSRYENGCKGGRPKKPTEKPYGFESETICETIEKPTQNHSRIINRNIDIDINGNIDKDILEDRFNILWGMYPKKVGKKKAHDTFIKLNPSAELFTIIVGAVDEQKRSKAWNDITYIPYLSTWLNQSRWEDEPVGDISSFDADEFFNAAVQRSYEAM